MNFGGPEMSRFHTTKTGITIGGKFDPPVRPLNSDEEHWQKVYLQEDSMYGIAEFIKTLAFIFAVLAFCFIGYLYGN